jgi:hypothetical protein
VFGNIAPHSMAKSKHKRTPKTVLKLPDLEQSKSAVMNSLTSASSKRSYDHAIREFIDWYCSEPRLAFNRTVVTRYRIANVALPHIAGNLGASNDESTWVLTSYLVSDAVVLPISGFLVDWLGRKRFFLMCIAFFTVSSFFCGLAPSLGILLLFRVLV